MISENGSRGDQRKASRKSKGLTGTGVRQIDVNNEDLIFKEGRGALTS